MERSGIRENLDFGLMACIPAREVFVQLLNQGFPDTDPQHVEFSGCAHIQ
jgi:hypothetical protein